MVDGLRKGIEKNYMKFVVKAEEEDWKTCFVEVWLVCARE
jgi:hypothetical protein